MVTLLASKQNPAHLNEQPAPRSVSCSCRHSVGCAPKNTECFPATSGDLCYLAPSNHHTVLDRPPRLDNRPPIASRSDPSQNPAHSNEPSAPSSSCLSCRPYVARTPKRPVYFPETSGDLCYLAPSNHHTVLDRPPRLDNRLPIASRSDPRQNPAHSNEQSAPIELDGKSAVLSINIEGITKHSTITVELQDQAYRAISGYEAEVSIGPTEGGVAQIIAWNDHAVIEDLDIPFLVRVNFEGLRPEDVRLDAVYLDTA